MGMFMEYKVHEWLGELKFCWLALHYDNPVISGAYASEIFGGSYSRQLINFAAPDNRAIFSINDVLFPGLPAVKITHICGWDVEFNGNCLFYEALDNPINMTLGKSFSVPAGTLALSMD